MEGTDVVREETDVARLRQIEVYYILFALGRNATGVRYATKVTLKHLDERWWSWCVHGREEVVVRTRCGTL